jgi:hypothetical protein
MSPRLHAVRRKSFGHPSRVPLRLESLLRAHSYMKIERPPRVWDADTEDVRFVPLLGEMIAAALGAGTPLAELTLSAANVVVEPFTDGEGATAGSPEPAEYVALTVRGVADFGPDATWKPSAPPPTGLLARLHERLETAGARFAYVRRLPPEASFTVFLARA